MVDANQLGRKTGKGFYTYPDGARVGTPNPQVLELIEAERAERGITPRAFSQDEILRRYLCAMVNEGAKILQEGIAQRPRDIDMVMVFGYGFPRYWGGPMKWADLTGLDKVLSDIEQLEIEDSFFWAPSNLLSELVKSGGSFGALNDK